VLIRVYHWTSFEKTRKVKLSLVLRQQKQKEKKERKKKRRNFSLFTTESLAFRVVIFLAQSGNKTIGRYAR